VLSAARPARWTFTEHGCGLGSTISGSDEVKLSGTCLDFYFYMSQKGRES
jgi:hypothetical protein